MTGILDVIRRWRDRWELDRTVPEELDRMLSEVGMTHHDLAAAADGGEHVARLLPAMLALNGIEAEEVRRELGLLFRDLERVCNNCREVKRCRHLMDEGAPVDQLAEICPNAATMASLASK
ncbi:hypothetical protein [Pinisolibacter sp.]|mgnify:FL=1|uniref:hypothetical protein n=1 Tax=Pinisolibacter sp. TaxID=2172024 RepID=UPI002FDCB043